MILSRNEAWLLATGSSFDKEDIRIKLNEALVLSSDKKVKNIYYIADIEEAKELYRNYKKTYRRRLGIFKDEFIDNTLIVQLTQI
ncbi:hypothetical protein I6U48_28605 [Clostridium sp. PL3]|uniref:Uncharacterized protein n=1 Tax=Clostridium thailandense TaxID=2794346 RepID=A0A949U019_9CLOT|nr:hypothetical protein [Clostridium thailandense]MBV7276836.1 hypothetical protein [Clostridium thailandense]